LERGKDKRYFDREFKYEAIQLMDEGKRMVITDLCPRNFQSPGVSSRQNKK